MEIASKVGVCILNLLPWITVCKHLGKVNMFFSQICSSHAIVYGYVCVYIYVTVYNILAVKDLPADKDWQQ